MERYITDVLGLESLAFYTHDRGSSVGFALLDERRGPRATRYVNGSLLAHGMRNLAYSMPQSDEMIAGVASNIDYQGAGEVQHPTIQYLADRAQYEEQWLNNLRRSPVPATLIWGVDDPIAPTAVSVLVVELGRTWLLLRDRDRQPHDARRFKSSTAAEVRQNGRLG